MQNTLYCILGETCSGKDTIVRMLEQQKWGKAVCSYTTRPPRDGEVDGREHYFVDKETFDAVVNSDRVMAYTQIGETGYEYCATIEALGDANIYVVDPAGLEYLNTKYPEMEVRSIYIYAPLSTRLARAKKSRSDFDTAFEKRVKDEAGQFEHFRQSRAYDYLIDSSTLSVVECVEQVKTIMKIDAFTKLSKQFI